LTPCSDSYTYGAGLGSHATQLIKFGARWYDPTTGTWTQQDTLNAPLNPANGNRYTYAADNPTNNTDPTGASCDSLWDCVSTPLIYAAGAAGVLTAAGGAIGCTIAGGPFDLPGCVAAGGTGAAVGLMIGWWGGLGYGIGEDIWGS
jgi:RHS repeat-associated protein